MEPVTLTTISVGILTSLVVNRIIYGSWQLGLLMKKLTRVLTGSVLIIVGPEYSGKTAFTRILLEEKYPKQGEGIPRTVGIDSHRGIVITGGKTLHKLISSLSDFSGQMGVALHGGAPSDFPVNGIVVCLQADEIGRDSRHQPVVPWFNSYCESFSNAIKPQKARKYLYAMVVIITKADHVTEESIQSLRSQISKVLRDKTGNVLGANVERVRIFSGNLCEPDGVEFMPDIVEFLIQQLKLKQPLIR